MNTALGTPPRGTQSSAAAFFASPTSPIPRRPGATPSSVASSHLRGASTPLSRQPRPHSLAHTPPPPLPHKAQSSMDRYVAASSRHGSAMAHFLLTSTEQKTPMLIRAAQQQRHHSLRSPSRDDTVASVIPGGVLDDGLYPSPTRYAVDHASPNRGAASPRPHGSLPRAGSTRLSDVFAKMHLDPSVRSSRDRSLSSASAMLDATTTTITSAAGGEGDGGGNSPLVYSFSASAMEMEPYTSKLARTLFSDAAQTTVLSVNDTSTRPTAPPPPLPLHSTTAAGAGAVASLSASVTARSLVRTPATPLSPDIADLSMHFDATLNSGFQHHSNEEEEEEEAERAEGGRRAADGDDGVDGGWGSGSRRFHHHTASRQLYRDESDEDENEEADGDARADAARAGHHHLGTENFRHRPANALAAVAASARGAAGFGLGRHPLATSDVNLHGMTEGERYDASLGVVFECNRTRNFTTPSFRVIPHTPERILDAADMEDDFYMNLIDWSATADVLCVALQSCVYLWDAKTCGITELPRVVADADPLTGRPAGQMIVCGLNWAPDGQHLAVGRDNGTVEVWDVAAQQMVHTYRQHGDRVVSLAWEPQGGHVLASGSRDSNIVLRDLRQRDTSSSSSSSAASDTLALSTTVAVLDAHETEVCGLKWSPNGAMLASGGNDNQLLLWDRRSISSSSSNNGSGGADPSSYASVRPLFYLNKHTAAVKALSWNPQQPALLASGGGSHDKSLRFWNTLTGECIHHINTGSQVCGVVWNRSGTELVTAHGYTDNQLSIWRYPSLRRIANLIGHTSRVLHLALSADGETVVSAAGDETLRFWRCFPASELRESSPHLYRSFYSPSSASSLTGSPYGGAPSSATARARAAAVAAGRCGSASLDRDSFTFMNEEVELR